MDSFTTLTTKEWFEFGFLIAGALGSIATFLAFFVLFRKDKDKQKQIDKLTDIAEATNRQAEAMQAQLYQYRDAIRLQHRPSIKIAQYEVTEPNPAIKVTICNYGKDARILLYRQINDCFIFQPERSNPPFDFKHGDKENLRFILRREFKFDTAQMLFDIIYSDEINFFYKATIKGNKDGVDLPPGKLLTLEEVKFYNLD